MLSYVNNMLTIPSLRPHLLGLALLGILGVVTLAWYGPIAQDQSYHHFADQRSWLGIPNAGDVISNLAFALVALAAIPVLGRATWAVPSDRWPWIISVGTLLMTALGSGYYHWAPADGPLFWDRLPLSLTIAALAAATLGERCSPRRTPQLLAVLLPLAALATCSWRWSGDLRPYAIAQFLPLLTIAWLALAVPARYDRSRDPLIAALFYLAAKLGEHFDAQILAALGGTVSGHTLKHLAAALGGWWLVRMLERRRPIEADIR